MKKFCVEKCCYIQRQIEKNYLQVTSQKHNFLYIKTHIKSIERKVQFLTHKMGKRYKG